MMYKMLEKEENKTCKGKKLLPRCAEKFTFMEICLLYWKKVGTI